MAYNPADYEARRRGYVSQYGTTGAMNAYANFLSQQRGNRERQNLNEQYDKATPQLVRNFARRGMVGPNVRSVCLRVVCKILQNNALVHFQSLTKDNRNNNEPMIYPKQIGLNLLRINYWIWN